MDRIFSSECGVGGLRSTADANSNSHGDGHSTKSNAGATNCYADSPNGDAGAANRHSCSADSYPGSTNRNSSSANCHADSAPFAYVRVSTHPRRDGRIDRDQLVRS
jgi:hypothetical protein